uniref:Uncharacterized protein n=1 Tax=Microbotryum cf. violaceum BFL-2013 TaxID=1288119 RepID=M1GLX9_9BASI|nr:hypothetical protein H888_mgp06 [Microbotryum cf. violaceum BFL-2013]AGE14652.1 hypothetical protein [Microbotryum cf. violaceum BFL-2013]
MLGDGSVRYPNFSRDRKASGNARYEMTMSAAAYGYVMSLYETVYAQYSSSGILPFPNLLLPIHAGKSVTQYYFATRSLSIFTALHTRLFWLIKKGAMISVGRYIWQVC